MQGRVIGPGPPGYDRAVDRTVLSYAGPTAARRPKPNWPMRIGLVLCLSGWAFAPAASWPAVADRADRAGGWLVLSGLAVGLLAVVTGPRRGWAMVAVGVQGAVAVALPVILGPGD